MPPCSISLLSPHPTGQGRVLRALCYKHMIHKDGCSFQPLTQPRKEQKQKLPFQMCNEGRKSLSSLGTKQCFEFQRRCPQRPHQTHSAKMFDELPWQASTLQINDQKSLVYISVEEDKFSLGFENLRDWESPLTTALLPSFTMLYHGSFTFHIPFQRVFINLRETDSMSVFCFFCNTMTTKWLEIVFGLV